MKKLFLLVLIALASTSVHALNSQGYVEVKEYKAWLSVIDVYLADNQEHQCSGSHKTRFWIEIDKTHFISTIMAAFAANHKVSLSYSCNSSGYPVINGIRVRQ